MDLVSVAHRFSGSPASGGLRRPAFHAVPVCPRQDTSTVLYCTAHKQPLHGPRSPDLGRFRPQGALCRYREPIPADKAGVYLLCFFQRFQGCDRAWRPTHRAHATGICASPRAVGGRCCAVVLA